MTSLLHSDKALSSCSISPKRTSQHISSSGETRWFKLLLIIFLIAMFSHSFPGLATVWYVKHDASGANTGADWANAFQSFQSALDVATAGDQIWVARGTYHPSYAYDLTNTSRYYHFRLIEGLEIYGGFAGTESNVSQRTDFWQGGANETILSGDLNGDDVVTGSGSTLSFSNNDENCYHVFYHPSGLGITSSTLLDGFTISGGNANGTAPHNYGGGIYNSSNHPGINNATLSRNNAGSGGAVYNTASSPCISNVTFSLNIASSGGAIYNDVSSNPVVTNAIISDNKAGSRGGALYISSGTIVLTNATIVKNYSPIGGGVYNTSTTTLNNCILWGNTASTSTGGHQVFNQLYTTTLNYSCYSNGSGDMTANNGTIQTSNNNITTNPNFAHFPNGDFRLVATSPCLDTGNDTYNNELYDIRGPGFPRKINKDDPSVTGTIDRGAYEYKMGTDHNGIIIHVKHDATGSNNGTSWANAYTSFQSALNIAINTDQIWVARGTYNPSYDYGLNLASPNTERGYHFRMINGVEIYGGFAGTETFLSERIDYGEGGANETILSGDLNGDDVITGGGSTLAFSNNGENCYHVFYHTSDLGLTTSAVLDGFTISGGNANGTTPHNYGGGIYNSSSHPVIKNVTLSRNSAGTGGAIFNTSSSPGISNATFTRNNASSGGAIYNASSNPEITNALFINNKAGSSGGALYHSSGSTSLINATISNNYASLGGGVYNTGSTNLNNCIIWGNTASRGKQLFNQGSTTTFKYSCYSNGSSDIVRNNGTISISNSITSNPQFVDAVNVDYRIYGISPCADAGNDAYNNELYDIRGNGFGRKLDKNDFTLIGNIDIGAYEYKTDIDPIASCYNPINGGTIASDQTLCSGNDPAALSSIALPTGHIGILEYKWQQSIISDSAGFNDIPGSNSEEYFPGSLTQTTWFKRMARVTCFPDWTGAAESNVITITFLDIPCDTTVTNHTIPSGITMCYNAVQTLTTGGNGQEFKVENGGNVTLVAGEKILMLPGTMVVSGGYLHGYITLTNTFCHQLDLVPHAVAGDEDPETTLLINPTTDDESFIRVYPNPTSGEFVVELSGMEADEIVIAELYTMKSELIKTEQLYNVRKFSLSLSGNPPGIYFIRVIAGAGTEITKIIKL